MASFIGRRQGLAGVLSTTDVEGRQEGAVTALCRVGLFSAGEGETWRGRVGVRPGHPRCGFGSG
jgi:hypothetical protein